MAQETDRPGAQSHAVVRLHRTSENLNFAKLHSYSIVSQAPVLQNLCLISAFHMLKAIQRLNFNIDKIKKYNQILMSVGERVKNKIIQIISYTLFKSV